MQQLQMQINKNKKQKPKKHAITILGTKLIQTFSIHTSVHSEHHNNI